MKKCAWLLTALFLLAGCTREEPARIWTASPASPTPSAAVSPEPESAWWEGLVEEDLPTGLASPDQLGALGEEEVLLLGRTAVTSLYVLGGDSGILLLRNGRLSHFGQQFSPKDSLSLPELYQWDYDGDGLDELAVRYLMEAEGDQIVYDLHIYDWSDETCTDLPVTRDACADRALAAVTSDYDPGSGTLTLSYGDTSAVYRFPEQYRQSPGRISFATSFFREQNGVFTVILGARAESTGAWFANVLADIEYDGADFTLRNLRVEPTTVV